MQVKWLTKVQVILNLHATVVCSYYFVYTHVCMYVRKHMWVYVYVYASMYVCTYICMYVCMYVSMYVCRTCINFFKGKNAVENLLVTLLSYLPKKLLTWKDSLGYGFSPMKFFTGILVQCLGQQCLLFNYS